jgi:hypothetical protein
MSDTQKHSNSDLNSRLDAIRRWRDWRGTGLPVGNKNGLIAVSELRGAIYRGDALVAELERVTAENDRLRAALSSALANEAQWWKKAQAALSPTYGPVGSLDGKGGVGW